MESLLCSQEFRSWEAVVYSLCMHLCYVQHGTRGTRDGHICSGVKKWQTDKAWTHRNVGIRWNRLQKLGCLLYRIEQGHMQLNKEMSLLHADKQGSAICGVQLDQENSFSFSPWGSSFRAMNSWGGGGNYGGNFLHTLSKLVLGPLWKTSLSPLIPHILL